MTLFIDQIIQLLDEDLWFQVEMHKYVWKQVVYIAPTETNIGTTGVLLSVDKEMCKNHEKNHGVAFNLDTQRDDFILFLEDMVINNE